jgi:hypothetical protein
MRPEIEDAQAALAELGTANAHALKTVLDKADPQTPTELGLLMGVYMAKLQEVLTPDAT